MLRLVAAGSTNREIAAALVLSEHTVARHVQNIFAQAARLLADGGDRVRLRARAASDRAAWSEMTTGRGRTKLVDAGDAAAPAAS